MLMFDKLSAAGNKFELPLPSPAAQWHISAEPILAQPMIDILCPHDDDSTTKKQTE